jgi:uncharacterized protein
MEILLDDSKGIDDLITRGNEIGQNTFIHVRSRFLDGNFAENWQRF